MNDYQPAVKQSNTMGLVGFIISLVSLVGCGGLLSPVSLIFSLIGLGKDPKGFAIAGLVLSLIGLAGFIFLFFIMGVAAVLSIIGLGLIAALAAVVAAMGQNAFVIADGVHDYYEANSVVPASLDDLNLSADKLTDTWGNEFIYVPGTDGDSFLLIIAGTDGIIANGNDIIGEVHFGSGDFNAELHHGYDDINPAHWGGLPSASPELPDDDGDLVTDDFPTPDPSQSPEAP